MLLCKTGVKADDCSSIGDSCLHGMTEVLATYSDNLALPNCAAL